MEMLKLFNRGLRFLLELCGLIVFGYWGFQTGDNMMMKFLLGLGVPILFAVVWGTFLAPKSTRRLREPWHSLIELIIFALACWALYSTGAVNLSVAFGGIYIVNKILTVLWRQQ